jgi:hypothetical protein
MPHVGDLCSLDALLKKYELADPALKQLDDISCGADTSRLDMTPKSAGYQCEGHSYHRHRQVRGLDHGRQRNFVR